MHPTTHKCSSTHPFVKLYVHTLLTVHLYYYCYHGRAFYVTVLTSSWPTWEKRFYHTSTIVVVVVVVVIASNRWSFHNFYFMFFSCILIIIKVNNKTCADICTKGTFLFFFFFRETGQENNNHIITPSLKTWRVSVCLLLCLLYTVFIVRSYILGG